MASFSGDGEYDSKPFLNKAADRGYMPVVKPGKLSASGFGAKIRDKLFDEDLYEDRLICEGFFGALTNWFGKNVPCYLDATTITRTAIRVICYSLRILLRIYIDGDQ
jgi:hypothetical protein